MQMNPIDTLVLNPGPDFENSHRDGLASVELPTQMGRFDVLKLVGEGGMARVFQAEQRAALGFRKPVALKMAKSVSGISDEQMARHLAHEAFIGAHMNHPNVVRTFDFGCLYSMAYVVLEWIDGWTLKRLLSRVGALPARAALELLQGICAGLAHAHDLQIGGIHLGLVHGDVKPSNVLIDHSGVPKVIDFGASQCSSDEGIPVEQDSSFGTPSYLSPEQALGALIDRRSDLFSMATLAYEVVTGKRLFGPSNTVRNAVDTGNLAGITRKASEEVESLVPGLGSILRGCWSELPEQRFSSAQAVSAALGAIQLESVDSPSLAECINQGSDMDTHDVGIESTVPLH